MTTSSSISQPKPCLKFRHTLTQLRVPVSENKPTTCRYFANLIEQRLGHNDNVIIITHEPTWLLEWFWASSSSSNLRQLVRGHLRGRARVHLAGGYGDGSQKVLLLHVVAQVLLQAAPARARATERLGAHTPSSWVKATVTTEAQRRCRDQQPNACKHLRISLPSQAPDMHLGFVFFIMW